MACNNGVLLKAERLLMSQPVTFELLMMVRPPARKMPITENSSPRQHKVLT